MAEIMQQLQLKAIRVVLLWGAQKLFLQLLSGLEPSSQVAA